MRIFLDLEKLKDPYSGLGQFCAHLGRALVATKPANANLTVYLPENEVGFLGNAVAYQVAESPDGSFRKKIASIYGTTRTKTRLTGLARVLPEPCLPSTISISWSARITVR